MSININVTNIDILLLYIALLMFLEFFLVGFMARCFSNCKKLGGGQAALLHSSGKSPVTPSSAANFSMAGLMGQILGAVAGTKNIRKPSDEPVR